MPSINVLGVKHVYELTNPVESQPTLVFVHGWLLSRQYWNPIIQQLSPFYPCLTYDLRGFGESGAEKLDDETSDLDAKSMTLHPTIARSSLLDAVSTRYTPEAYGQDLVLLLQQLNISRAWVIGHSLGGSIALWAGALAPNLIEGMVCLNSGGGIYLKEAFDRFRHAGQQMLRFRPSWLPYIPLMDLAFSRLMVHRPLARQWGKQRVLDFVAAHPEAALRSLLDSTLAEQVHLLPQVVAQLQQPTFFLAGQQDQVMELKYVYHLASFHRSFQSGQSNVIEIPDCGHMGMIEQTDAIANHLHYLVDRSTKAESSPSAPLSA